MKYLDEFRDGAKARILVTEIDALVATMDVPHDRHRASHRRQNL